MKLSLQLSLPLLKFEKNSCNQKTTVLKFSAIKYINFHLALTSVNYHTWLSPQKMVHFQFLQSSHLPSPTAFQLLPNLHITSQGWLLPVWFWWGKHEDVGSWTVWEDETANQVSLHSFPMSAASYYMYLLWWSSGNESVRRPWWKTNTTGQTIPCRLGKRDYYIVRWLNLISNFRQKSVNFSFGLI